MQLWRQISAPLPKSPALGLRGDSSPTSVHGQPASIGGPPGWWLGQGNWRRPWLGASSWRPWRLAGRERGCWGAPAPRFTHHLTMVLCFYGRPGLLPRTLPAVAVPRSSSFRLSVPATPVLPTGLSCKPPVPASAHPSKRVSQAGTPRAVA